MAWLDDAIESLTNSGNYIVVPVELAKRVDEIARLVRVLLRAGRVPTPDLMRQLLAVLEEAGLA